MMFMEERGRIYAADETGAVTAEILFNDEGEDAVFAYVRGLLREEAASEAAKKRGKKVVAACSYAEAWLQKHPEYKK